MTLPIGGNLLQESCHLFDGHAVDCTGPRPARVAKVADAEYQQDCLHCGARFSKHRVRLQSMTCCIIRRECFAAWAISAERSCIEQWTLLRRATWCFDNALHCHSFAVQTFV